MGFKDREHKRAGSGVVAAIAGKEKKPSIMGRPKVDRETQARITFSMLPSLHDKIKKIAYIERMSVSKVVAKCLEEYASKHADKIAEYDSLFSK